MDPENLQPARAEEVIIQEAHESETSSPVETRTNLCCRRGKKRIDAKVRVKFPKANDSIFSNPEILMSPEDLLLNHGYVSENHEVHSEDGYVVSLLRIPYPKGQTAGTFKPTPGTSRPVVLFAHGIACTAITWVFNSDENVLAYQLADQGFDCWLLNARGTPLSLNHDKLSSKSRKYWKFSWHEMANYDIPAVINHILKNTGQEQLFYVGHSMGCAVLFGASSLHPEVASKIKLMVAYAPAVFLSHARTLFVKTASRILPLSLMSCVYHGQLYSKPTVTIMRTWAPWVWVCPRRKVRDSTWFLWKSMNVLNGKDDEQINWPMLPIMAQHIPSHISVMTYDHFLQAHKSGKFQQYDHGRSKNIKKYGQPQPPEYDLKRSTFPVAIFHGQNDICVTPEDVEHLSAELPNVAKVHCVDWPQFNHFDFVIAKDANKLLNTHVLDLISQYL